MSWVGKVLWMVTSALALAACTAANVQSGFAPNVNFAATPKPTVTPWIGPLPDVQSKVPLTAVSAASPPNFRCGVEFLASNVHVSASCSFEESENSAVGLMVCHIERDTCEFGRLVNVTAAGILFFREEPPPFNDEDSLMHPAMVPPLLRLNELLIKEWGGAVQLMVTDAYDSHGDHDLAQPSLNKKYSQHFEGRSIDLVTWPVDVAKYPRLCALAFAAGYDWVHNEVTHCHASIKADTLCGVCKR